MRNVWGIVCALALGGCASQAPLKRAEPVVETGPQNSTDPNAITPDRQDAIERTFARKTGELQDCWTREYEKSHDRKLEGNLTIQMNISPEGRPSDIKVVKSTMNNAAVESCVPQMIGNWSFPEGAGTAQYLRTVHLGAQF